MKRKIENTLLKWKALGRGKMPLLLYGARQIGKTYSLQEFGAKHYGSVIYLNFETDPSLMQLFSGSIDPEVLLPGVERYFKTKISPANTLLIFDEIQNCNRALTSLKYFCENAPGYDVIGAGSLLGVHISAEDYSFPVGKVITETMYPMSFQEFIWQSGKAVFSEMIEECYCNNTPMEQTLHQSLLALYKEYLLVGGMPLAVYNYFTNDRILSYTEVQRIIIDTQISDMVKYAGKSQGVKTISTYNAIVPQLARENRKFQYKMIAKGARASLFGESIDWLLRAGAAVKATKIIRGDMPPAAAQDLSAFKLYMGDIGLACYKAGLTHNNIDIFDKTFMGGITENYVAGTLRSNGYELFYWASDSEAEVDFVIMKEGRVIPVEVKSGENVRSYALNSYVKRYKPDYAIRLSAKNFGFENGIKSVPLYAAYLI